MRTMSTATVVWNLIKLPFTLLSAVFMIAQLLLIYYAYQNREKIIKFAGDIQAVVGDVGSLVSTADEKLNEIDQLSAKLDEAMALLREANAKLDTLSVSPP